MSLRTRLSVIGVAILACTLAVVALLAYEFSRVQGRAAIDDTVREELAAVSVGLPDLISDQATGPTPTSDDIALAVQRYLATHPGSDRHLTIIRIADQEFTTSDGPEAVLDLLDDGALPETTPGQLRTIDTSAGPIRALSAALTSEDSTEVGHVIVLAPLGGVLDAANETLARIAVAGIAGLVIGGLALTLTTRRALSPMRTLAEVAQTTSANDMTARAPQLARHDEIGVVTVEFNRMLDRIAADNVQRRRLLAAISHELRTPVAIADGHLEMFETLGPSDEHTAVQLTAVMRTELGRLSRLVDDLSAFAQGSLGNEIDLSPVFIPDAFDDLRARLAGLGMTAVTVEAAPPVVIEADPGRLAQCLLNLVINAHNHTPPGTAIRLHGELTDSHVCLAVDDNGPGIDPRIADRVLEPFVTTREGGAARSSGLGLAVVQVLTEAQHGTVHISTSSTGTKVSLCFPHPDSERRISTGT